MTSHKARNIALLLILLALVLAGANYMAFLFIKHKTVTASEMRADTAAYDERQRQLFGTGSNDVAAEIAALKSHVLDREGSVAFIESIESRAKELGLSFEISAVNIDPVTDENKENLTETLRMDVEATGSWQQLMNFVFDVEHMPYRVFIENAAFSQREGETGKGRTVRAPQWRLRAELTVLKQK